MAPRIDSLHAWLACLFATAIPAAAAVPAFHSPETVDVGVPFALKLMGNGADIKSWAVDWGDGSRTQEAGGDGGATHTYAAAGIYRISASVAHPDGSDEPASQDYASALVEDRPAAWFPAPSGGSDLDLPPILTRGADRFCVEFRLKPADLESRQEIVSSRGAAGTRVYLEKRTIFLEMGNGAVFFQTVPLAFRAGVWNYIAINYDRVSLFPFQNNVRFYFNGVLTGQQHLDVRDTGPVALPEAVLGKAADGGHVLKGEISDLAFYDRALAPHRILAHAGFPANAETETVAAVRGRVQPFTVEAPQITGTIAVALDSTPGVDNGPVLRAAIAGAAPGSRLRIIDKATGNPGSSFYINSLDKGNDWSAIRVHGKQDLEIDGGGATLVFGVNCRQFLITGCQRVAFRDFGIDLDQSKYRPGVYARIVSLDTATGEARFQFVNGRDLSPDRTVPKDISMWRWRGHDPKTLRIGHGPFFKTAEVFEKWPVRDAGDASILAGRIKPAYVGMLEEYRKGANFFMINNARFQNTPVGLWGCEQVTFDRVHFYASLGMVFLSSEVNHLAVTGCTIGLPPGLTAADRPLAAAADGYHFHDTQGWVLFESNEIALTDDDPISIKDGVYRDIKPAGGDAVIFKGAHAGDEFVFYRRDFSPLDFRAKVIRMDGDRAQLDRKLPAGAPASFLAQNTSHHTENWIIKDSFLHDYYGRLLLCAPHGLIVGNEIRDSYVHLGANDASFDSAGIASQIDVENNLFADTDVDTGIWGDDSAYMVFQEMTFSGNSFVGRGIRLRNAGAPLLWENYFEKGNRASGKQAAEWDAVVLSRCSHPKMLDNVELNEGATGFSLSAKETEGLIEQNNLVLQAALEGTAPDKRSEP